MKLEEKEQIYLDIKNMSNAALTDYAHDLKQLLDAAREEVDERVMLVFPELSKEQVKGIPPVAKVIILKRVW
jgi:hypothetical protein